MINITKYELKEIRKNFPGIRDVLESDWEKHPEYKIMTISVFDHYLNEHEIDTIYDTHDETVKLRRQLIENSIKGIYENTKVYLMKYKRKDRLFFYNTNSLSHLLNHCNIKNQHWWTGQRFNLILPEYDAIYSEDFDWGNAIFYLDVEKIKPLSKIIEDAGMHILDWGIK